MQAMQARVDTVLRLHANPASHSWSAGMARAAEINTLKTYVSTTALEVAHQAMMICGMAGYKQGTPFSIGRHIRDLHGAADDQQRPHCRQHLEPAARAASCDAGETYVNDRLAVPSAASAPADAPIDRAGVNRCATN